MNLSYQTTSPSLKKKQLIPVKLSTYMAFRQASKGKHVIKDIRGTQFISKLQFAKVDVEAKRKVVVSLVQKLIQELIKKKIALQTTLMEELYQQQRLIQNMLQTIVCSSMISGLSDYSVDNHVLKSRLINQLPINNHVIFEQADQNSNITLDNFKLKVVNIDKTCYSRPLSQRIINTETYDNRTPKDTILRNSSINNLLGINLSDKEENKRPSARYSNLQLKLESRVQFKQNIKI